MPQSPKRRPAAWTQPTLRGRSLAKSDNAAGLLKPDMYVDVILQEPAASVIAVPESAVMNTGTRSVVFIARGNGAFEPRQVATGGRANGFYEIRSGVQPGERVVVDANFLVDSESRLKSALSQMR